MDASLQQAVRLFNDGRYAEFQDALGSLTSGTRAPSERQFYTLLDNLAEALLQLSDGDLADAEGIVSASLRKMEEFLPRFRGLNVAALRDDFSHLLMELRETRERKRAVFAPSRIPRLRVLPE